MSKASSNHRSRTNTPATEMAREPRDSIEKDQELVEVLAKTPRKKQTRVSSPRKENPDLSTSESEYKSIEQDAESNPTSSRSMRQSTLLQSELARARRASQDPQLTASPAKSANQRGRSKRKIMEPVREENNENGRDYGQGKSTALAEDTSDIGIWDESGSDDANGRHFSLGSHFSFSMDRINSYSIERSIHGHGESSNSAQPDWSRSRQMRTDRFDNKPPVSIDIPDSPAMNDARLRYKVAKVRPITTAEQTATERVAAERDEFVNNWLPSSVRASVPQQGSEKLLETRSEDQLETQPEGQAEDQLEVQRVQLPDGPPAKQTGRDSPQQSDEKQWERYLGNGLHIHMSWWSFSIGVLGLVIYLSFVFAVKPPAHYGPLLPNGTAYSDALNGLSKSIDQRFGDLSREMAHFKSDVSRKLRLAMGPAPSEPPPKPRINFLSPNLGTIVNLDLTSPTEQDRDYQPVLHRIFPFLAPKRPQPNPPETALTWWNEVGDAWCSPVDTGTTVHASQISLHLGRSIVPEEVVVEHVARSATPDPGAMPRQMELWAEFVHECDGLIVPVSVHDALDTTASIGNQGGAAASADEVATHILSTLKHAHPHTPVHAFSNDQLLGPTYFRIGAWEYEADGGEQQVFRLEDVLGPMADGGSTAETAETDGSSAKDSNNADASNGARTGVYSRNRVRTGRVVARVKGTWGAPWVCLYRLRLHGRM